ncbi:MAG: UDP-2,3-diacylglucosamine diphosphatase LpxI [Kiritimatiellae bacterium]|nr:UDP-2,3-diacylglucosamine diphosphatase LpxI [Kiritimatiellia bacterium]
MRKLVIVAGSGSYPRLVAEGARRAGVGQVDVVAIKGSTSRATCKAAHNVHWITLGGISEGIRWAGREGYEGAILAGQVSPLSLFRGRFDPEIKAALASLPVKTAHTIFGRLSEMFDAAGVPLLPASLYMDDAMPGAGALTEHGLSESEAKDVEHAMRVADDMGRHDVGQSVLVKSGMVLAVEAFEGTNAAIRRGGRLGGRGSILYKAARPGHDMRFDIPVAGLKTLKTMRRAGVSALAFQAGRLVLLDKEECVRYANRHGIALAGMETSLPPAPLRP